MLMWKPTIKVSNAFQSILQTFELALGLEVNLAKSELFFLNTPPSIQTHLTRILGIADNSLPTKYLGDPLSKDALRVIN